MTKSLKPKFVILVVIASLMLCPAALALDVSSDEKLHDNIIEIIAQGKKIEFSNAPFIKDGEVYVPLYEFFEKIGLLDNYGSYLHDNNGKLELFFGYNDSGEPVCLDDRFELEIGRKHLFYNPSNGQGMATRDTDSAPIAVNSIAYIPYSYIGYMLNADSKWEIECLVHDRNSASTQKAEKTGVSVIGGADSPTDIFVVSKGNLWVIGCLAGAVLALVLFLVIKKQHKRP